MSKGIRAGPTNHRVPQSSIIWLLTARRGLSNHVRSYRGTNNSSFIQKHRCKVCIMPSQHKTCACGKQLRRCTVCNGGGSYFCMHSRSPHRCKHCAFRQMQQRNAAAKKVIATFSSNEGEGQKQTITMFSFMPVQSHARFECLWGAPSFQYLWKLKNMS